MKIRSPNIAEAMLGLSLAGIIALGAFFAARASAPPRLVYESVAVKNITPVSAEVLSETRRRSTEGCTNGIQADLRANGVIARLPVPLRAQTPGMSSYALVLPNLTAGEYEVKVRESFICRGTVRTVETPWLTFRVQ